MFCYSIIFLFLWNAQVESLSTKYTRLLNDGNRIPILGLGAWFNVTVNLTQVRPSITAGIEAGFRMVDTAHLYANEHIIGEVLRDVFERGIVTREDIFISTKLDAGVDTADMVIPALEEALARLQLDYVDSFLIHLPYNSLNIPDYDYVNIWKGMEEAKMAGLTKSIGVSNFNSTHINRLLKYCKIRPAINEIEVNPTYANMDLVGYCQSQSIVVMAYGPLGMYVQRPFSTYQNPPSFDHPTLVKMAKKYGKDQSQVVLRYLIDRGVVPIPRSHDKYHISLNIDLYDFSLTPQEVCTISQLNLDAPSYPKDKAFEEQFGLIYFDLKARKLI